MRAFTQLDHMHGPNLQGYILMHRLHVWQVEGWMWDPNIQGHRYTLSIPTYSTSGVFTDEEKDEGHKFITNISQDYILSLI